MAGSSFMSWSVQKLSWPIGETWLYLRTLSGEVASSHFVDIFLRISLICLSLLLEMNESISIYWSSSGNQLESVKFSLLV